jgi:hypothetical protein
MKRIAASIISPAALLPATLLSATLLSASLADGTEIRGAVRVEQASEGKPYDFVVHVRNIPDIGYNPLVRADRTRMALRLLKRQCPAGRVVGDDMIITEIWGITSSLPDYVVLVRCA